MKNSTILVGIFILIALVVGFIYINSETVSSEKITGNAVLGEVQKVLISQKNYNYYPDIIKVKQGIPVELTLDNSVTGCLRSFSINDFGVRELSRSPEEKIVFTPDKKGTFDFSCSMGMGYGTIIVE